jgi:3-methyladenine DNA glycosylase/8-oxoguanine DNA glycosylase
VCDHNWVPLTNTWADDAGKAHAETAKVCTRCGKTKDRTEYISDLERRLKEVEDAARAVVWFDWSSCDDLDDDVIDALVTLRRVIGPEPPQEGA